MKVEIIGTLKEVQEILTFDSGFTKQTAILQIDSKYDNLLPIEMVKDGCGRFDGIEPGTRVKLECYLGGREWNDRYFLSLKLAEITGVDRNSIPQNASAAPVENAAAPASKPAAKAQAAKQHTLQPDDSDLPF